MLLNEYTIASVGRRRAAHVWTAYVGLGCLTLSSCVNAPAQAVHRANATDTTTAAAATLAGHLPSTRPASVDSTWRDQHPVLLPPEAIMAGHQGVPVVLAQIGVRGEVLKTQLEHSTGYAELDAAAVSAVQGWKFQPCYQDGSPQVCWTSEPVKFTPPNSLSLRALKLTILQPGYSVSPEHPR
jgi:TonB family protein